MSGATTQGELWGRRPRDWAYEQEPFQQPLYDATLAALAPLAGVELLDVGCGSGLALSLAAALGARVSGLDASGPLLEVARVRTPAADLRVGEIEKLPYADGSFDVVTAFNSLQYPADRAGALRECVRVARPGGRIAVGMWGDPSRCDSDSLFAVLASLMPPAAGPMPLNLAAPGALEKLFGEHDLAVAASGEVDIAFTYPDLDTAWRVHSSAGPFARAIDHAGAERARAAFDEALAPSLAPDGSSRQNNVMRYLIGIAPSPRLL